MSDGFFLKNDVHFCKVDGVYIFLQASRDRYFAMTPSQARLFDEIAFARAPCSLTQQAAEFLSHLLSAKILTTCPAHGRAIEAFGSEPPSESLYDLIEAPQPSLTYSPQFIGALLSSHIAWWRDGRRMDRIALSIRRWRIRASSGDPPHSEVLLAASAFHSLTPYGLTTSDRCLFRTVALIRYLSLFRLSASLEIGVRTSPFAAHCWAEHSGIVLNDHTDNVREYAKIWSI